MAGRPQARHGLRGRGPDAMSAAITPPCDGADGRRTLLVRAGLVVAVLVAIVFGVASQVVAATPPFSVDEPRPDQPVAAGEALRASGSPGDAPEGSLWVLAAQPSSPAGTELYTIGGRATLADGRWSGTVTIPATRPGAPVAVVIVQSDPTCGTQLDAMAADQESAGRFYGPLPAGCTALATVPLRGM